MPLTKAFTVAILILTGFIGLLLIVATVIGYLAFVYALISTAHMRPLIFFPRYGL